MSAPHGTVLPPSNTTLPIPPVTGYAQPIPPGTGQQYSMPPMPQYPANAHVGNDWHEIPNVPGTHICVRVVTFGTPAFYVDEVFMGELGKMYTKGQDGKLIPIDEHYPRTLFYKTHIPPLPADFNKDV